MSLTHPTFKRDDDTRRPRSLSEFEYHAVRNMDSLVYEPATAMVAADEAAPETAGQQLADTREAWYRLQPELEYPQKCLHELFRDAAARWPERVAIRGEAPLTFAEVDAQSDRLARALQQCGVGVGKCVGLFMDRRAEYIVGYIAIHKAGGAYLPIETAYPASLVASVLADASCPVVLTQASLRARLPVELPVMLLDAEREWLTDGEVERVAAAQQAALGLSDADLAALPAPTLDDLAYVVYSSGTTGQPKGICCPHRGAVFSYHWRHEKYPFVEGDVVACNVFFVWECLRPLLRGVPVVVIPDHVILDPVLLVPFIRISGTTRVLFTPSLLQACLDAPRSVVDVAHDLAGLNTLVLCGEVVTAELRQRTVALLPHVRFLNLYSVSECHDVSIADMSAGQPDPWMPGMATNYWTCGVVFSNVGVVVLIEEDDDDDGGKPSASGGGAGAGSGDALASPLDARRVAEAGEVGEVFVSGLTLALGYLNQPAKTAERFPTWRGQRVYRTGDLGILHANRQLEVLGRCDSMVKVRGYSVVLDLVEAKIMEHPDISTAMAKVVDDDSGGGGGGGKKLVAFVTVSQDRDPNLPPLTVSKMYAFLFERLPHYAIPSVYVHLRPTTALSATTGKRVSRKTLPPLSAVPPADRFPVGGAAGQESNLRSRTEEVVLPIWAEVLRVEASSVSISDNFFVLGGHSLSATALLGRVREAFGVSFTIDMLYEPDSGTLRGLCAAIDRQRASQRGHQGSNADGDSGGAAGGDDEGKEDLPATPTAHDALAVVTQDCLLADDAAMRANPARPFRVAAGPGTGAALQQRDWDHAVLTGATGFLGAHLLAALLTAHPHMHVHCIVRAADAAAGRERLRKHLEALRLWPLGRSGGNGVGGEAVTAAVVAGDAAAAAAATAAATAAAAATWEGRVHVVVGDLALPRLGLADADFGALAQTLGEAPGGALVLHCGAVVNMTLPYSSLRHANVNGTRGVLELAFAAGGGVEFVYVSTLGVFPHGVDRRESDATAPLAELHATSSAYSVSKAVGEELVAAARGRGLPAAVVRPGNMAGHSRTGAWNPADGIFLFLASCCAVGAVPDLDPASNSAAAAGGGGGCGCWNLELTPVDYAAAAIVRLAAAGVTADRDGAAAAAVEALPPAFHIVTPYQVPWPAFLDTMQQCIAARRTRAWPVVPYGVWKRAVAACESLVTGNCSRLIARYNTADELVQGLGGELPISCRATVRRLNPPASPPLYCPSLTPSLVARWFSATFAAHLRDKPAAADALRAFDKPAATAAAATAAAPDCNAADGEPARAPPRAGPLGGRVALVTGASSGIGRAIALRLAAEGAFVVLTARRADRLREAVAEIHRGSRASAAAGASAQAPLDKDADGEEEQVVALAVPGDVTSRSDMHRAAQAAVAQWGAPVDLLVAAAGIMPWTYMKSLHQHEWAAMVDINFKGVLNAVGAVLEPMLARKRGHILVITSDAGRKVFAPGLVVYSATKHAVEALCRGLRTEVAEAGVRVTTLQPGDVRTDLAKTSTDAEAAKLGEYVHDDGVEVLETSHIADAAFYALTQPRGVAVNEILIEPTQFPL